MREQSETPQKPAVPSTEPVTEPAPPAVAPTPETPETAAGVPNPARPIPAAGCAEARPDHSPGNWLLAKEIPGALTIVLAILAWCLVHAVSTIQDSPSIGYERKVVARNDGSFDVSFRVSNISRNHFFRGVSFYILAPEGSLSTEKPKPLPPAKVAEDDNLPPQPQIENGRVKVVRFYVAQFQPGTSWIFHSVLSKVRKPDPQLLVDFSLAQTNPMAKVEPASLRLIPNGPETCLVEHYVFILLCAAALWFIIAIVYIWKLFRRAR